MITEDTDIGKIGISDDIVAALANLAAMQCDGVAGMAVASHRIQDGLAGILGKESLGRGVEVLHDDDKLHLKLYVTMTYGSKIMNVAREITQRVRHELMQWADVHVGRVEIMVEGVRFPSNERRAKDIKPKKRLSRRSIHEKDRRGL